MRILLDMDGPLAGFDDHGYTLCAAEGVTVDVAGPHAQTARYFTDHIPDRAERARIRKVLDSAGWFRSLPVVAGAQDGVDALLSAGVDVWVCTKPLEVNPTCRDEKGAWLREHFPMLERKLIIAPDKSLVMASILLDDAPNPAWVYPATWMPVVFDAPFNRAGSVWERWPRWTWSDTIDDLLRWGRTVDPATLRHVLSSATP